jgi:hypothetical protein
MNFVHSVHSDELSTYFIEITDYLGFAKFLIELLMKNVEENH